MSKLFILLAKLISIIKLLKLFIQKKKFENLFNNSCEIGFNTKILNPKNIKIGKKVFIGDNVLINASKGGNISIGDFTNLAADVKIFSWLNDYDEYNKGRGSIEKDVVVGQRCRIGYNVIIMPGVTIGDNVTIAPASVVSINVPPNSVVHGNPAEIIS